MTADEFVLACSRVVLDQAARARAESLLAQSERLDWDYVLEVGIRHAVAPLMHNALIQLGEPGIGRVPARHWRELVELREASARRAARLRDVTAQITTAFEAAEIEVLGLKDIVLGQEIFGDLSLRPMGDVDLLVRRAQFEQAAAALDELGFAPHPPIEPVASARYATGRHFRRAEDETWIDLQWNVAEREWDQLGEGRFTYDVEKMWARAEHSRVAPHMLQPSWEDMLFHLCLHLEGHEYAELILVCDIAELLRARGDSLDWSDFFALADGHRARSTVVHALLVVERLLGASAPPEYRNELAFGHYDGGLLPPLFGNLTALHSSLDKMRAAAAPPARTMAETEASVRGQAARARALSIEFDDFAATFANGGGSFITFVGQRAERMLPDPVLRPFNELHGFVLAERRDALMQTLTELEYRGDAAGFEKELALSSRDPAIQGRTLGLTVAAAVNTDGRQAVHALTASGRARRSNRKVALSAMRQHLRGSRPDDSDVRVALTVHALPAEQLLIALAVWAAQRPARRLFESLSLVNFLGSISEKIDERAVVQGALELGVGSEVSAGLSPLLGALGGNHAAAAERIVTGLNTGRDRPKLFAWARIGPSVGEERPELRDPYFVMLTFFGIRGARARLAYAGRALSGRGARGPGLLATGVRLAGSAIRKDPRPMPSARELVHWIE
ncbi:MAG: nucleotidyltransferase family protein [Gaiellaceae bacterium]